MSTYAVHKMTTVVVKDDDGTKIRQETVYCDCCGRMLDKVYIMTDGQQLGIECAKELSTCSTDTVSAKKADYFLTVVLPFMKSDRPTLPPRFKFTLAGTKYYDRGRWY